MSQSSLDYPEMKELFDRNAAWSAQVWKKDPGFFPRHFPGQRPEIMWIGCSDARVPETTIMGCHPGDIFVQRNVANTYSPADDSLNAVLMIALQNFKVKHIVITGHTNCVGCNQALNMSRLPSVPPTTALQRYIQPVAALARSLTGENGLPSLDLLVEENVCQQVKNIEASDVIRNDWKRRGTDGVVIHGWVYHLENGTIRDLNVSVGPPGHVAGKRTTNGVWF
ncbi:carbonic anhydrase [Kockovaella imperatae]|uniref:Carbonic anhydrase n=1 Tax=Kockovaella imperatae TaxID=4999 RepID=A0A1Y1UAJ0_9TREE|nr:carbonic anhydrase [Kockovaella imperatae]ORX34527.1 carbonic anhydrase [Kockovaella imperatae]